MTHLSIARCFRERTTTHILRISTTVFLLKVNPNDVHLMANKFQKNLMQELSGASQIYLSQTLLIKKIKICPRVWKRQFVHSNYTENATTKITRQLLPCCALSHDLTTRTPTTHDTNFS